MTEHDKKVINAYYYYQKDIKALTLTRLQSGLRYSGTSQMLAKQNNNQCVRVYFFYSVGGIAWLNFAKINGTWKYFWG